MILKNKIALVSRVAYPHACPRSNRVTNLAIQLSKEGYEVTVYCLTGQYDYSSFENEHNVKFHNIGKSYLGNGNSDTGKQSSKILFKIIKRVFGRILMFPEVEIMHLIYKKRKEILKNDFIISIAAPFAIHFGINLIYKNDRVWISDCGDPFMGNPHYNYPFYFRYLENSWAKNTSYITVPTEKAIKAYPDKYKNKIKVIPQGFPIIKGLHKNYKVNNIPTFCYSGVVYQKYRDPTKFLEYLTTLSIDFKFIIYTKNIDFFAIYKERLGNKLILNGYIPRKDLLVELSKMDFLINIKNESNVQQPSKLIDYYMTERPILEISSNFSNEEKDSFENYLEYKFPKYQYDTRSFDIVNVTNEFINLLK